MPGRSANQSRQPADSTLAPFRVLLGLALALPVALAACAPSDGCTTLGCESMATVTYDRPISVPYDLSVIVGGESGLIRCNEPDALDAPIPPVWLSCDPNGFVISGDLAIDNSAEVSISTSGDPMEVLANRDLVSLNADPDGTLEPNGPGCEPICFVRRGVITLQTP